MKTLQFMIFGGLFAMLSFANYTEFDAAKFLREMADARMMDAAEGKLAAERGTTQEIRDYGKWMVKDQGVLIDELQKVAAKLKISLPKDISPEKFKALQDLKQKQGKDFDSKFLKMIKIDHKRDVKEFTTAMESDNGSVGAFARKYLPTIQSHLDGVEKIKEEQ
jgi:putative membrane protein